jgi:benzylsuccinate CoA-transferase BbsE subunit
MNTSLDGLRVVDLAGPYGNYCGKLLADLGADVVLVERPEGSELRTRLPVTAENDSMWFTYHNANKRSAVIKNDDADTLVALLASTDVLIGSGDASWPSSWGLDLRDLEDRFPHLVVASITPFGLVGPYASFDATDIVCLAMGGLLSLGGYGDGAPLQAAGEQALTAAASFAAVGTMMAVLVQERTGSGQLVDVSAQECVTMALEHAVQYYDLQGVVRGRQAGRQRGAGAGLYRCADGYVYLFVGGIASGRFWTLFIEWLREEGADGVELLTSEAWNERSYFDTPEAKAVFLRVFEGFASQRNKEDLTRDAQSRGIALAPVRTISEVVASDQLKSRQFFQDIETPSGRVFAAPGAPYQLHGTPWNVGRRAPRLGEHTEEILAPLAIGGFRG